MSACTGLGAAGAPLAAALPLILAWRFIWRFLALAVERCMDSDTERIASAMFCAILE